MYRENWFYNYTIVLLRCRFLGVHVENSHLVLLHFTSARCDGASESVSSRIFHSHPYRPKIKTVKIMFVLTWWTRKFWLKNLMRASANRQARVCVCVDWIVWSSRFPFPKIFFGLANSMFEIHHLFQNNSNGRLVNTHIRRSNRILVNKNEKCLRFLWVNFNLVDKFVIRNLRFSWWTE